MCFVLLLFVAFWSEACGVCVCVCSGVLDGRPVHELPACVPVPARHLPVGRGYPRGSL